jgi:type II secretory ATPase GspE/PulE/Tfp pilus assembly ATPase PilB-like protein
LHTNDAPGGVARMVDMGVEPYLVSATVLGIVAQRLVRVVCDGCAEEYRPPADAIAEFGRPPTDVPRPRFRRGRGCEACAGTGYRGRTGIYELMQLTDELRGRIVARAPLAELRALAERDGLVSLRAAGWAKACAGITSVDEVLRVTRDELL